MNTIIILFILLSDINCLGNGSDAIRLILKNDQLLPIEKHCILDEPIDKN